MDIRREDIPYNLHTMVEIIGNDDFLEVCKMYGGTSVYIPVYHRVTIGERNRRLVKDFNGRNIDALRVKYGISNEYVRKILKREGLI